MSNDNLILFPKKSNPIISMSESEAKWMIAASLMVVLTMAIGINSSLFTGAQTADSSAVKNRSIASINPLFKVSWEKKAFEVLEKSEPRDLASVGKQPTAFDNFAFAALEGKYSIRLQDGVISELKFASQSNAKPKHLMGEDREQLIQNHMALFAKSATTAEKVHQESNDEVIMERYQLKDGEGQDLSVVHVISDGNNNLISMTVQ